jgi:hypothetical protein
MPSKPYKYGNKFWLTADSKTYYVCNGIPYVSKQAGADLAVGLGSDVVLKRSAYVYNTGRNITMDNFCSSVPLAESLLSKRLTMLGTMRKEKKQDIPQEFLPSKQRPPGHTIYGFKENLTLVSYSPKKGKAVILLSMMHHSVADNQQTGKPEMIMDYNATKGGVDTVDQLCSRYTVQRSTRRWPLSVFFGLLDIIGINAMVIIKLNTPATLCNRRYFLEQLALELVTEHAQERTKMKTLAKPIRDAVVRCGFATYPTVHNQDHQERKMKRCHY